MCGALNKDIEIRSRALEIAAQALAGTCMTKARASLEDAGEAAGRSVVEAARIIEAYMREAQPQ